VAYKGSTRPGGNKGSGKGNTKPTYGNNPTTGLRQDKLTREQLMAKYGYTAKQINLDDDIFNLFERAWQLQMPKEDFISELHRTNWWQENNQYLRDYLMRSANPDADWNMLVTDSREAVRQEAMTMGIDLSPQEIEKYTDQSMREGWYDAKNRYKLRRAIMQLKSTGGGEIANTTDSLRALAYDLGVNYSDQWYQDAARSVASSLTTADYWGNQMRQQAAKMFPQFGDAIMAGQSLRGIASPYTRMMQDEWDIPEGSIKMSDPTILRAMGGDGGNQMMNLSDFQRMLRRDPRWMETDKAQNDITGIGSRVLQMFGMMGRGG
jgi:hypothetical protein